MGVDDAGGIAEGILGVAVGVAVDAITVAVAIATGVCIGVHATSTPTKSRVLNTHIFCEDEIHIL